MKRYQFELDPYSFVPYLDVARKSPDGKVTTQPNFGLVDLPYGEEGQNPTRKPWERFISHVKRLNDESLDSISYKVIFLTRHGLGFHNVQEAKVGTEAWNDYWAPLDGDGTVTWADAKLVPEGIQQAKNLAEFWESAIAEEKVPLPQTLYCSPLARCLETCKLEFARVFKAPDSNNNELPVFQPKVRELLRERLWDHSCDKRSTRSWIEQTYPGFELETGFTEEDTLWKPGYVESLEAHAARKQIALEEIFDSDRNQVVSLTIHSGAIAAILRTCGAADFHVKEGSCIVVLMKGTKLELPN